MTSQDIKKTAERTTFLEHCINWSARRTEDKSNAGSKRYHNLASTCSGPASMGKDIKRNTHPGHPEMCIRLYTNEERNTLQKSYRLLQPEVILQKLPDRCNQNK